MMYPKFTVAQQKRVADIYGGRVYHAETGSGDVSNNGTLNLLFQTNNYDADVLTVNAAAGGLALLRIYTTPSSINAFGVSETLRNYNRKIGDASVTASVTAQCSYQGGDAIFSQFFGAEGPGFQSGGQGGFSFVLPNSTQFIAELQNLSGGATNLNLEVEWARIGN